MIELDRSELLLAAGCTAFLAAACQSIAPPSRRDADRGTYKNLQVLPGT